MSGVSMIVICAALAVSAFATTLVLHREYEDGLIGRIALAMIALAGLARVWDILQAGSEAYVSRIGILLWLGLAIFLGRHLYRFLRWHRAGENEWRRARPAAVTGKK